jgi:hypothetical protein
MGRKTGRTRVGAGRAGRERLRFWSPRSSSRPSRLFFANFAVTNFAAGEFKVNGLNREDREGIAKSAKKGVLEAGLASWK